MRNKGISLFVVKLIVFWVFVAAAFGLILFHWKAQLSVENNIEENEVLITRKVILGNILMSSDLLAYTDENGIHRGVFDINKIKSLDEKKLFETYSYKPDKISKGGYSHFVRIDSFESPTEKKPKTEAFFYQPPFFQPITPGELLPPSTMEFPVAVRYSQDDIRVGKLYVGIIKSAVSQAPVFNPF